MCEQTAKQRIRTNAVRPKSCECRSFIDLLGKSEHVEGMSLRNGFSDDSEDEILALELSLLALIFKRRSAYFAPVCPKNPIRIGSLRTSRLLGRKPMNDTGQVDRVWIEWTRSPGERLNNDDVINRNFFIDKA
ncbi:hypothetical protein FQR65_LT00341 [Abscondita terminalis]|nr:hypothetical protein FQR65_LT00341 [Abscondita terminalis]